MEIRDVGDPEDPIALLRLFIQHYISITQDDHGLYWERKRRGVFTNKTQEEP
jgi:hypothetical protein